MKFRKKPVVIDAIQYTPEIARYGWPESARADCPWLDEKFDLDQMRNIRGSDGSKYVTIKTLEGVMRADVGDWIIKGVKDEIYPCKPDIFEATYEPVSEV
jgi:hypothetical protein